MASHVDVAVGDDGHDLVLFNLGSAATPAYLSVDEVTERAFLDPAAQLLLKRKMIELAFVYTGWGPDRGELLHHWRKWHIHRGLYSTEGTDVKPKIREIAEKYFKSRTNEYSAKWKSQGIWTNRKDGKFCVLCGVEERPENREGHKVTSVPWAAEVAAKEDWNGEFTPHGELLCNQHLTATVTQSFNDQNFTTAEAKNLLKVVEDLIKERQQTENN